MSDIEMDSMTVRGIIGYSVNDRRVDEHISAGMRMLYMYTCVSLLWEL